MRIPGGCTFWAASFASDCLRRVECPLLADSKAGLVSSCRLANLSSGTCGHANAALGHFKWMS